MKKILATLLCGGTLFLGAQEPEVYQTLATHCSWPAGRQPERRPAAVPVTPNATEAARGFRLGVTGISTTPQPDFDWPEPPEAPSIRSFQAKGELRRCFLVLRGLEDFDQVNVQAGTLRNGNGREITAENFFFQRAGHYGDRDRWEDSRMIFLTADQPWRLKTGDTLFILVNLYVPEAAQSGLYRGEFTVTADGRTAPVPVELAVLDWDYQTPEGAWGMYIPGDFYGPDRGEFKNMAPEWWTAENLELYIRYLKSRGFNSPVLFHLYGEMAWVDNQPRLKLPFLERIADLMTKYRMTGPLGVDVRNISWYAYAAARKLNALGVEQVDGDLGIYGPDGLNIGHTGEKDYPESSKKIFAAFLHELVRQHREHDWPRFIYCAEEEIGYPTIKTIGYEAFNPTLRAVVGDEDTFLIDNAIGYAFDSIDRGARDHLRIRSYNNWTEEGLENARRDQAHIWYYNGGWNRNFAIYLIRIGATAYHQWADAWQTGGPWIETVIGADGLSPSIGIERTAEGLSDLFYFRELERYLARCRAAGLPVAAELQKLYDELFTTRPVNSIEYATTATGLTDQVLDRYRWQCVEAINQARLALGEPAIWTTNPPAAKPQLTCRLTPLHQNVDPGGRLLQAVETDQAINLDGRRQENIWQRRENQTDRFRWSKAKEAQMRALASSEEEFQRMEPPSGANCAVAYDDRGLYLWAGGNHVDQKNCSLDDDDPNLWSENNFEFFFRSDKSKPIYHLIVSVSGKRVMLRDGQVQKSGTRVVTAAPLNPSGGVGMEIFIPWTDFGLSEPPSKGTLWQFNVCRAFHTRNELSSWAQFEDSFGLADGQLAFAGPAADGAAEFRLNSGFYPGRNRLAGTIELKTPETEENLTLALFDPANNQVASRPFDPAQPDIALPFQVPETITAVQNWRVALLAGDRQIAAVPVIINPAPTALAVTPDALTMVSAESAELTIQPCVGELELARSPLTATLLDAAGQPVAAETLPLPPGKSKLQFELRHLPGGRYRLQLGLHGKSGAVEIPLHLYQGPF